MANAMSFVSKTVSHALLGEQVPRLSRIDFDLAAQGGHEDAQVVRFVDVVRTPDFFQQKAVCQHFAGVTSQRREQLVLQRREMNLGVSCEDTASGDVDLQVPLLEGTRFPIVSDSSCRNTSWPSMSGSPKSRITKSGGCCVARRIASLPVSASSNR